MPQPVSREFLRNLKAAKQEQKRIKDINDRVSHIYKRTLEAAELFSGTVYRFPITESDTYGYITLADAFYRDNMKDIINCLQIIFHDCSITYTNSLSHPEQEHDYIVIDWS